MRLDIEERESDEFVWSFDESLAARLVQDSSTFDDGATSFLST